MRKFYRFLAAMMIVVLFAAVSARAATASKVVSADRAIPALTNTVSDVVLSKLSTSKPLSLTVYNAIPTNGTANIYTLHQLGNERVYTNTLAAINLTALGGTGSTNLTALFPGYLFRNEPLHIKFDVYTNGAFQVIGELYE
jgi:hypothetical protein